MYTVKELYYTLQGEGAQTGRAAVFLRFSGCNLWSGHEEDRAKAVCSFCDTDFVGTSGPGGGKFAEASALAAAARKVWPQAVWPRDIPLQQDAPQATSVAERPASRERPAPNDRPLIVCTGGEPLLQLDEALIAALHHEGFEIAIETNGTLPAPPGIDWICVSPKAGAPLRQTRGDELKLIYPQAGAMPETYDELDFAHFFLQPKDDGDASRNTGEAAAYCLAHPRWRLSLQTHKLIGLP